MSGLHLRARRRPCCPMTNLWAHLSLQGPGICHVSLGSRPLQRFVQKKYLNNTRMNFLLGCIRSEDELFMGTHSPLGSPSNEDLFHGPSSWRPSASLRQDLTPEAHPPGHMSRLLLCYLYRALWLPSHLSPPSSYNTRDKQDPTVSYQLIRRLCCLGFPVGRVKHLPANPEDMGSIPGSEDPLEENITNCILAWKLQGCRGA